MKNESMDHPLNVIIGQTIRHKREVRGLSLDNVCDKLNKKITKQALSNYENGIARLKNKMFIEICYVLNENPADVWEEIYMKYLKQEMNDNRYSDEKEKR